MKSKQFYINGLCVTTFAFVACVALPALGLSDQYGNQALDEHARQDVIQKMKEKYDEETQKRTGPIILSGSIVEEDGNPLKDVLVRVRRAVKGSGPADKSKSEKTSFTVGPLFSIHLDTCIGAQMEFTKEGFYPRKVNVIYNLSETPYSEPFEKVRFDGRTKIYEDAVITFRRVGQVKKLKGYGMFLRLNPNGDREVFNLNDPWKRGGPEVDHAYGAELVKAGESVSSGTMFLEMVPARSKRKPLIRGGEYDWPPDRDLLIVLDDGQDGGLIRVAPGKDKRFPDKRPSWFMRKAPAGTYEKQLRLTQDDWAPFRNGDRVYFYCRINGKYGKGSLSAGYGEQDGFRVDVRLVYQPDGTVNVETKR